MGLIAGVVAAGVIGAGASAYGASQQAGAQSDANATNAQNARYINQQNTLLQLLGRGQNLWMGPNGKLSSTNIWGNNGKELTGSAILPQYLASQEQALGGNASDTVNSILAANGSPDDQYQAVQAILANYQPAFQANTALANQIATGQTTQQMLQEAQPGMAANLQVAQGRKNAALESLAQTLNQIDAVQAKRGYAGDSLGQNLLKFQANRQISMGASDDLNQALLQNALQTQSIKNTGRGLQLQNVGLAGNLASQDVSRGGLPGATVASRFNTALQPLSMFNIGRTNFGPNNQLPIVQPVPNNGMIAGETGAALSGAAGNYLANQNTTNQLIAALKQNGGGGTNITPGSGSGGVPWVGDFGAGGSD